MEGGKRKRIGAKTEREGECRVTRTERLLGCSYILTRSVSIASRFSTPAEKVQFS